jgi:tetratricopeptide (TPR) repeat protein
MSHPQQDGKGAYTVATQLLDRALQIAPDDPLALFLTARVNLCDCVDAWSTNVEEQRAIGAAALEKYLQQNPDSLAGLTLKSHLYQLYGRFEESLLIAEAILERDRHYSEAIAIRAFDLLKLGRPVEALSAVDELRSGEDTLDYAALAAAIHYQLGDYERAAQLSREAATKLNREQLSNRKWGAIPLTTVAAEARLGRTDRAKIALADFHAAVPGVESIGAIRRWIDPLADLAGHEPLYEGLRLAGVKD